MKKSFLYGLVMFLGGMLCFTPLGNAQTKKIRKDTLLARQVLNQAKDLLGQGQLEGMKTKLGEASRLMENSIGKENALYADILHQVGRFHFASNDVHAGIAATEQSLGIRLRVLGADHLDVATSYQNLGSAYGGWSLDFEKAMEYRQKAWEIRQKKLTKDDPIVIKSWKDWLFAQGVSYRQRAEKAQLAKNWDLAVLYLQKADSIFLLQEDYLMVFFMRTNLAEFLYEHRKFNKSLQTCEAALQYLSLSGQKDSLGEAVVLNTYGNCLLELNRIDESEKAYLRALQIKTQLFGKGAPETGSQLSNLASIYQQKGQFKKAIELAKEGLNLREKVNTPKSELINPYLHLAFFYNTAGFQQEALTLLKKAEQILAQEANVRHGLAAALADGLGSVYHELGDFDKALAYRQQAILSFTKEFGPDYHFISRIHFNLGLLAIDREDWPEVIAQAKKALKISLKNPDDTNPVFLIDVYEQLSDGFAYVNLDSALHYAQYALHLCEALPAKDDFLYFNSLVHQGLIYKQLKLFTKADSLFQLGETKFLDRFGPKHTLVGLLRSNRAQVLAQSGNYSAALEKYETSLQVYGYFKGVPWENLVYPNAILATLQEKNHLLIKLYQQNKSQALVKTIEENFTEILDVLSYLRRNYHGQETKLFFAKQFRNAVEDALDWYHRIDNAQALDKAWIFAEKSHALAVLEAFLNTKAWQFKDIPDSLRQTEALFKASIANRTKIYERATSATEQDSCYRFLLKLKLEYESWLKSIEQKDSAFFKLKYAEQTPTIKEVQASLNKQQSLLEYFIGENNIYIFLIQSGKAQLFKVPKDTAFAHWIDAFTRQGIYGYYAAAPATQTSLLKGRTLNNYGTSAFKLYQTLIFPLQAQLTPKIIIIPDGILNSLPFEAFLTQQPPRPDAISAYRYLLHNHQISYANSVSLLKEMRQKKHSQEPTRMLLAMAPFSAKQVTDLPTGLATSNKSSKRDTLSVLAWSDLEVSRIAERFKEKALYGKEASLTQFLQQAPKARIIHLSTHGKADDRLGDYVYLAFSTPDKQGNFEKLYARDLYNLSLNADLVVLSACETGLGKLQSGEGIISLARAFAYAGTKSIVTTLWKVYEEQSQQLIDDFYKYLLEGKEKDEALHLAKLNFLQKNAKHIELTHPFFWASFINIGDTKAVK